MSTMIQALGYRVLVRFDAVEETPQGGIIIASETKRKEQQAQVKATLVHIGPNAFDSYSDNPHVKVGATVLVSKYGGMEVPGEGNELLRIYNDEDIAAVEVSV